jgi:hypothetical protein
VLCADTAPVSVSAWAGGALRHNPTRPDVSAWRLAKTSGQVGLCHRAHFTHAETDVAQGSCGDTAPVSIPKWVKCALRHNRPSGGEFVAALNLRLQAGWWPRAPSSDAGTGTALRSHVITSSLRVTARGEGASRRWGSQHKWREDGSTRRAALKFWRPLPSPHAPKQSTNLTAVGMLIISAG